MPNDDSVMRGMTLDNVRQIAARFPGLMEGTSRGTPAFRARDKFLARMYDDGASLVLKVGEAEQDLLIAAEPDQYWMTDHYIGWPFVLCRLANFTEGDFARRFERSWRGVAQKRDILAYQQSQAERKA